MGSFTEELVLDGEGVRVSQPALGASDAFALSFSREGVAQWVASAATSRRDRFDDVAMLETGEALGALRLGSLGDGSEAALLTDSLGHVEEMRYEGAALTTVRASDSGGFSSPRVVVEHQIDVAQLSSIAPLPDGGWVLVGGYNRQDAGLVTFDAGGPAPASLQFDGWKDIFLARFDSSGSVEWVRRAAGGPGLDWAYAITAVEDGVVIAGQFGFNADDTVTFGPGEANEVVLSSLGENDAFVAGFGTDGSFRWVTQIGSEGPDSAQTLTLLGDGRIAVGLAVGDAVESPAPTGVIVNAVYDDVGPGATVLIMDATGSVFDHRTFDGLRGAPRVSAASDGGLVFGLGDDVRGKMILGEMSLALELKWLIEVDAEAAIGDIWAEDDGSVWIAGSVGGGFEGAHLVPFLPDPFGSSHILAEGTDFFVGLLSPRDRDVSSN